MIISTEIIETAINTIKIEHQAIKRLIDSIDQEFVSIVELIYKAKGRLVITGIGKSAIIGQKIVATLNSTGTAALFACSGCNTWRSRNDPRRRCSFMYF